jgi:hypothetical protein
VYFPQDCLHVFLPYFPFYINYSLNVTWSSPFSQTITKVELRRDNDWGHIFDVVSTPRMPSHGSVAVASFAEKNASTPIKCSGALGY